MKIFEITVFWIHISPSYYGLMYALWFIFWYWLIQKRIYDSSKKVNLLNPKIKLKIGDFMDNLLFYIFFWVVIGWRLWYVIFYNFSHYLANPIEILKVWEWWMSFHWGVIWVLIAMILFSKKYKINFFALADQIILVVPIWLWLWRLWNYLNKELLGFSNYHWLLAVQTEKWSFFPSPLIELFLEWIVLFIVLNYLYIKHRKKFKNWQIASLFLILYWIFRIFTEVFFRMPDDFIGYIWWYFTLWELYSLPMIIIWIYFYIKLWKNKNSK